jgi:predicted aspartyl protease
LWCASAILRCTASYNARSRIKADGSEIASDLCLATIIWDGQPRAVEADPLESEALVGMALMEGYDLNARIVVGGRVTLEFFSSTQSPIT